jgi:chromosome partitioning protein
MTDQRTPEPTTETTGAAARRVVALMNQKGGVGKTTTTVNLAAGFAQAGKRTLLIDLDPQAHATLHLGVDPRESERTVYDALHDPATAPEAVQTVRENLDLLPAEVDLAAAETELAEGARRHRRLAETLAALPPYEVVLIDCPPSLGLLTLNALAASDEVLVPMQAQFLALQGVGKLLETVSMVASSLNPRLRVLGVTLCMHDDNTRLGREVIADLESFFADARQRATPWSDAAVFRPAVRRHIKLAEAASFGQTIFEYAPGLAGAEDYGALTRAILARWAERASGGAPEATPEIVVRPAEGERVHRA